MLPFLPFSEAIQAEGLVVGFDAFRVAQSVA